MIGQTLSHFKIIDKLGQGGMGVVYRGVDLDLDRPVAIKILPPEAQQDEDSVGRFLREAKTASKLQHPVITTIYEFGVKDNLRYLVMEYIEGKTLREMLSKGPLPIRQAMEIVTQVADALSLAGEKGIIHRDIKSENVMVTTRGQVKILDFGLAKMVERAASRDTFKTTAGLVMGTVSYMSPEQALGAELDGRTDIYSTGVLMFEMITSRLPFTGSTANIILAKILNQPPPTPSDYCPDLTPGLERVIMKCLEKNRENRYQTAMHLLVDLKSLKQQVESASDLGRTIVAQPGREIRLDAAAVENLGNLVPSAASGAAAAAAVPPPAVGSGALGSGAAAPAVRRSGVLSGAVAAPALAPAARAWRKRACYAMRGLRWVIATVGAAYALGCLALFATPLLRAERVQTLPFIGLLHDAVDPAVAFVAGLVTFNFTYKNFNFIFPALALATWIVRGIVTGRLNALERWVEKPLIVKTAAPRPATGAIQAQAAAAGTKRASLLREYAAARRILGEAKREMAFLSVDVVGSTRMKVGEDKLVTEHAFTEYKKFLERIFREFRVYKMAWTPDGVMTCFPSADDAASAGRKLLTDLDWFNRDVHQMRTKFHVRCGVNFGEVMIPEEKPLEEVSDHVIDVAGHMQKEADEDTLWISGEAYNQLLDRAGFTPGEKQVDNHEVYIFRKPTGRIEPLAH